MFRGRQQSLHGRVPSPESAPAILGQRDRELIAQPREEAPGIVLREWADGLHVALEGERGRSQQPREIVMTDVASYAPGPNGASVGCIPLEMVSVRRADAFNE